MQSIAHFYYYFLIITKHPYIKASKNAKVLAFSGYFLDTKLKATISEKVSFWRVSCMNPHILHNNNVEVKKKKKIAKF